MLVLGRKVGEEIIIGDRIRLVVVDVRGSQVRLGFDAPPDVRIQRDEVRRRGFATRSLGPRPWGATSALNA